jgi:ribosomal protein L40E
VQNECVSCGRSAAAGSVRCQCGGSRFRIVRSAGFNVERGARAGQGSTPATARDTRSAVRRAIEERGEKECPECGASSSSSAESCTRCGTEFARALLGKLDRLLGRPGPSPQSLDPVPGESVDERDARHRALRNFAQTRAFSRPLQEERRGTRPIYALSPVPGVRLVVGYVREGFDAFEARSAPDRFERECQRVARCAAGFR